MTQKRKILIVDDEEMICEFSRSILERTGRFDVSVSTDPKKGVELAQSLIPDLIILDVNMPGLDGGDIANILAADASTKDIPIVFLTGLLRKDEESSVGGMVDRGRAVYIAKPISSSELIEAVETYVGKSQ